jgi:antitoxin component YwqK of YwqJK toxin-antitoxin module
MKRIFFFVFVLLVTAAPLFAEEHKAFYPDGKLEMEYSDQGQKNYWENGKLRGEIPYKNGKINGILKTYYSTGKLMSEVEYKEGKAAGPMKTYLETGAPIDGTNKEAEKGNAGDIQKSALKTRPVLKK